MTIPKISIGAIVMALGLLVVIGFAAVAGDIAFRLWWNGAIAQDLVESLEARFPGAKARGGASYEREIVYITVVKGIDEATRPDVERWLRDQKSERRIGAEIWLRFQHHADVDFFKL